MESVTLQPLPDNKQKLHKKKVRRNFMADRTFQLSFAANLLAVAVIAMIGAGGVAAWIFVYVLNDRLCASLFDPLFLFKLGVILTCIGAAILVWTLLRAHAIAGPIAKTRRILKDAADGRFPDRPVAFRHGDAFQGLAEDLNRCLEAMRRDSM